MHSNLERCETFFIVRFSPLLYETRSNLERRETVKIEAKVEANLKLAQISRCVKPRECTGFAAEV